VTIYTRRALVGVFIFLILALAASRDVAARAQRTQSSVRERFVFLPGYRQCHPAEVKGFAFGNQPVDVLLAQVTVGNRSDKTIAAVKLGWKVYSYADGIRVAHSPCDNPPPAEVLLAGTTQLLELSALAPKETSNISTNPLILSIPATKTVFVDRPFLTADDVKSLPLDGPPRKIKYMVILYIAEIQYADNTTWTVGTD
jgi:hypothetical protein